METEADEALWSSLGSLASTAAFCTTLAAVIAGDAVAGADVAADVTMARVMVAVASADGRRLSQRVGNGTSSDGGGATIGVTIGGGTSVLRDADRVTAGDIAGGKCSG